MISPLYLFSYWILAWFVLWMLVKLPLWASPLLALVLALLENVVSWFWLWLQGASWSVLKMYAVVIALMKVFPLGFVLTMRPTSELRLEPLLVLFLVYCAVVVWGTGQSPWQIYVKALHSMLRGTSETPLMTFFKKLHGK
jgi:hypothetical protein